MNTQALLIALLATVVSPAILAIISNHLAGRQRRAEKKFDWDREDEVARKAEEAARLLLAANERVAKTAAVTNGKLDQIHTLVNSNMTAAMRETLSATIEKLALMREIVARDKADNIKILPEALQAIRDVEIKIGELTSTLNDRLRQTQLADQKVVSPTT